MIDGVTKKPRIIATTYGKYFEYEVTLGSEGLVV